MLFAELPEVYSSGEGKDKNVLNMGIYLPRGSEVGNPFGFRGWSGGAKKSFFINNETPSTRYIAGPIYSALWKILIYPLDVSDSGFDWEVKITAIKETSIYKSDPAKSFVNDIPSWYHGELHLHTLHSDGKGTAQELIAEAHT